MYVYIYMCVCLCIYVYMHIYTYLCIYISVLVGPCHHGMARPQVTDRGTASDKKGSCE